MIQAGCPVKRGRKGLRDEEWILLGRVDALISEWNLADIKRK